MPCTFVVLRSITGRLYAAIGILLVALLAVNIQTIVCTRMVATGSRLAEIKSIRGMRVADDFNNLVNRHRKTVFAAAKLDVAGAAEDAARQLDAFEQEMALLLTLPGAAGVPSADLREELHVCIRTLASLSRPILDPSRRTPQAMAEYFDETNRTEMVLPIWKAELSAGTERDLAEIRAHAGMVEQISFVFAAVTCLLGLAALLLGRGVIARLRRLTSAMLALAHGDIAAKIPFLDKDNEFGHLATALEVFRKNAVQTSYSEANMRAVLESMGEGIIMFSTERSVVFYNQQWASMFNLLGRNCIGMKRQELLEHLTTGMHWPEELIGDLVQRLLAVRQTRGTQVFDLVLPDKRVFKMSASIMPDGRLLLTHTDVSERRQAEKRIRHLANHDPLTDLPNRAMFRQQLRAAIDGLATRRNMNATVLLCDLDNFKEVNDTYGHPAGDDLLCQVAQRMRELMRSTDILSRLGGDEFAIIHPVGSAPQDSEALARRIVGAMRRPFEIQGHKIQITVSIGIARAPLDAASPIDLMKQSDLALYAAKRAGRNRCMAYDASMTEHLEERRALEAEMHRTLEEGGFEVFYQPQVDLRSRRIIRFEALARWRHAKRGFVPPAVFIPIAEESGQIIPLGDWVLRHACREAMSWGSEMTVAVNVSPHQFRHDGFIKSVRTALRDSGLPAERLELEVTESALLRDDGKILEALRTLRSMSIRIALDDFGTGFCALNYLQKFPVDRVKIDQSFVRDASRGDANSRAASSAIVHAVTGLCGKLGIPTIAEGIENEEQVTMVLGASCGEGQGYLFGRPVPAGDVSVLLADASRTLSLPAETELAVA
jgi:diguanylate cyclase (GGDEF)-like protein